MADSADDPAAWAPLDGFPADPEFYRRALHHLPSPLIVVNTSGQVVFANQAMLKLGGWPDLPGPDVSILDFIHPDDAEEIATAFAEILESPRARMLGGGTAWPEIYLRIVTTDGSTVPIEIVGNGGLMDPVIGGIIYEVRPTRTRDLLGRVLEGLSQGASMHHLLSLVAEMITSPPLDLDAVILQSASDGSLFVAASTSPVLTEVASSNKETMPWRSPTKNPSYVPVSALPKHASSRLSQAGYKDLWHLTVESPLTPTTLRIIGVSPTHPVPASGQVARLVHARELAAAVLLRSQSDVLLDYAAGQDRLTELPNRAAFHQAVEAFEPTVPRAALHLDLDGLSRVNKEHGQASGDAVLRIVADRLRAMCGQHDIVGRVGDDEFSVLLAPLETHVSLKDRSVELATGIHQAIRDTIVVAGRPLALSASIGVAVADTGISNDHLLTWADAAMHDAKRGGGDRICRFGVGFG